MRGEHRLQIILVHSCSFLFIELISNIPHIIRYNLKYLHDNQVQIRYTSQRKVYLSGT